MSKEIKSKRYSGVYYREVDGGKDRSYFLRFRLNGKIVRETIGRKSEGITEAYCNQKKIEMLNAARFGEAEALKLQKVKDFCGAFRLVRQQAPTQGQHS